MKKLVIFLGVLSLLAATGCKKNSTSNPSGFDNKDLVNQIFKAGMEGYSSHSLKSTFPVNYSVDHQVNSSLGGYIHVTGSITGSISVDDQTAAILGGTLQLGLSEAINAYAFTSNGNTYTMNGAPYISLAGTFTLLPGGNTFGTASSMEIGGGVKVTGNGVDQTVNMNITIIINSNGSGGHVSGTIGGVAVDFSI